eukprot:TRINITY_DN1136_c0_g1_i2.p1 TRINITY_DN1136_c0_g1~~TRINITY_DN1136_c0_g1_i2.p1  ORF type:complete len:213 (+),score=15.90 TRINITY_DN1136_c0_g1_i2:448-1086(+)
MLAGETGTAIAPFFSSYCLAQFSPQLLTGTVCLDLDRWSLIAEKMPGRTDNEIKNYWRSHIRKKHFPSSSSAANREHNHNHDHNHTTHKIFDVANCEPSERVNNNGQIPYDCAVAALAEPVKAPAIISSESIKEEMGETEGNYSDVTRANFNGLMTMMYSAQTPQPSSSASVLLNENPLWEDCASPPDMDFTCLWNFTHSPCVQNHFISLSP